MSGRDLAAAGVSSLCVLVLSGQVAAASVSLSLEGVRTTAIVKTFHEMRQERVVRQRWDLSCGSAALSTILTHYHQDDIPESEIIVWVLRRTDPVKIRTRGGFSFLDLKRFVRSRGYDAAGYAELTLGELTEMGPAIVPVRMSGYDHFVVFWALVGDRVLLADPAYGKLTVEKSAFLRLWKSGIAFTVLSNAETARSRPSLAEFEELQIPDLAAVGRVLRGIGPVAPTRRVP